ncbi:respiratory-chain NADH dehydrogenase [Cystobasidium minutum MCA 4210]|uniref:respiratory-chain NADH dehydrogenase n=1 Tax=Cystobasidium minutum MCA 4210 TaxID=1397322 RepID=UPI0034CE496A|eukprot:jgi/Rhomi1/186779/estExt_fgenesh1_pm.C_280001
MLSVLSSLLEVLIVLVPILLAVAFMTIIERKVLASMQRRVGPNKVGYYGVLQPFSDALKLVVKETVVPQHSTKMIPFGSGITLTDFSLGILYSLAISSIGVYANSKYAFLGSLRSTAQMISYELIYMPLLPLFIMFFISALAETNRTPFDLPEAESELVAGFFTEHSGMIFVFFFLAEYCSIVLMSAFTAILFFGGYIMPEVFVNDTFINLQSIVLALKTCMLPMVIAFIILVPSLLVAFDIAPY